MTTYTVQRRSDGHIFEAVLADSVMDAIRQATERDSGHVLNYQIIEPTRTLTEAESQTWENGGPDGDDFRRTVRDEMNVSNGRGTHVEIYSHDGIVLDAWVV